MALRVDDVDLQRDRRLVERFQEGDPTAFDLLYRRYFARLQRFCLKRVGDPHEAEEIAQEAFARALRALPDLSGERRFYPWMTVIAGRLCVDHHRRRVRAEPRPSIDLGAVEGGQDEIVDRAELGLLAVALEGLAPRHREVLELREVKGWTYHRIAAHYDVPVGTVEALLFRARKALRREFDAVSAAAGGERWAGVGALPLLGALVKRIGALKAKAVAWSSAASPATAPALAAVAVAIGSAAAVGVATVGDHTVSAPAPAPVVRMLDTGALLSAGDVAEAVPAVGGTAGVGSASGASSAGSSGDRSAPVAALPTNTRVMSAEAAAAEAEEQPVNQSVTLGEDRILVGVNPEVIQRDLTDTIWNR